MVLVQLSCRGDFPTAHPSHLMDEDRDDRKGFAIQGEAFDSVFLPIAGNIYHRAHIPGTELIFR